MKSPVSRHGIFVFICISWLCGGVSAAKAADNGCVPVFDGMLFSQKPDLSAWGIKPIAVIDVEKWSKASAAADGLPTQSAIGDALRVRKGSIELIALDLEYLPMSGANDLVNQSVEKFSTILSRTKSAAVNSLIGYYGAPPIRDYWRAIKSPNSSEYKAWQSEDDLWRALADRVDVLFPSLYTFYDDRDGWVRFATANLSEARRLAGGKPVYAFIWPQYHESNKDLKSKFIPEDFWRLQLDTVAEYADGVVIWGGFQHRWDAEAPWWRATQDFISVHNCQKPLAPAGLNVEGRNN